MSQADEPHASVLLVDPDRITFLVVKQAIQKLPGFSIEHVETGEEALEFLSRRRVDLVISETELPDMGGIPFRRRLVARGKPPLHIFLSADTRKATRLTALADGVLDFLQKPCDPEELRLRCSGAIRREQEDRKPAEERPMLEGTLETLSLPDLLSVLAMARATGSLTVDTGADAATIYLKDGEPLAAGFGEKVGVEAIYHLLGDRLTGTFAFRKDEVEEPRTIHSSVMEILLEGARLHDEQALVKHSPVMRRISSPGDRARRSGDRIFPPIPTAMLARRFGDQVEDPFTMGELHLLTAAKLGEWTRRQDRTTRLHTWLICDQSRGARSMLEIASPVSELFLVTSIGSSAKVLALTFLMRDDLELDVLLIDPRAVSVFESELSRTPAFVMVSQATGADAAADASASTYSSIAELLSFLYVDLLLVSEDATSTVDWSLGRRPKARPPRVVPVRLGSSIDLRSLLTKSISEWGNLPNEVRKTPV
jgi:CheY-like chemotaxis protein